MSLNIPDACTLPTAERPVRQAEFDDLFARVVGVEALGPTRARLRLAGPAGFAAQAGDLTARETECCSFFTFTITPEPAAEGEALTLEIQVPAAHAGVLESMIQRATAAAAGTGR